MALSATIQWDVRTTGSDANGGGFDPTVSSPGTDFSQQNTAQVAFTDLVIGATTSQLTSVLHPFNSTYVGNIINIVSGTGFTVGRYEILSVSGITATMDRAVGTAASTGGTGNLGGSLASFVVAGPLAGGANKIWIQSGTYNQSTLVTMNSGAVSVITVEGYSTTHGDNGTAPTLNMTANSTNLLSLAESFANISYFIRNINFTTTATTKANAISTTGNLIIVFLQNCSIAGFVDGITTGGGIGTTDITTYISDSIITGCSGLAFLTGSSAVISNSVISGNAGSSQINLTGAAVLSIYNSLIIGGHSVGIAIAGGANGLVVKNCTIAGNAGTGILASSGSSTTFVTVESSIIYGNTGFGIGGSLSIPSSYLRYNAYGANTSGNLSNVTSVGNDVTLTTSPFTNSGSGDYSLNSTTGGGAACKGVGYPGVFPNGTTTGHLDMGAVQTASGGGSVNTGGSYAYV